MSKYAVVNNSNSPLDNSYDVIVIGGGVGGLAAAAILAKAGKKVLLVEKEPRLGGLTAPVVHGDYMFDVGARLVMGCASDGPFGPGAIHAFLAELGVRDQVEFIPVQPMAEVRFPGSRFQVWTGREQYIEGLRQFAPQGLEKLPALLEVCSRIFRTSKAFASSAKPWTPWRLLFEVPDFFRYATTKAYSMLDRFFPDRRARMAVGALWPYLGVPPNQASFFTWANAMGAYIEEGAYFCQGGLHQIAEAIGRAFIRDGGEIRLNCTARRVFVQNRKVAGTELDDDGSDLPQRVYASWVIANMDPRLVFGEMMGPAESPSLYRRWLKALEPTDPGISISIVTDLDLPAMGFSFENLVFDSWNEDQIERTPLNDQVGFFSLTIPTAVDPSLAPAGQHMVSAFAGLPSDAPFGPEAVRRYGAVLMGEVLKLIPDLKGHLLLSDHRAAGDGYVLNAFGPIYGWKNTPLQSTLNRPPHQTPIKNLILAGQWTRPSQGVMSVIFSGCEAARIILRNG